MRLVNLWKCNQTYLNNIEDKTISKTKKMDQNIEDLCTQGCNKNYFPKLHKSTLTLKLSHCPITLAMFDNVKSVITVRF